MTSSEAPTPIYGTIEKARQVYTEDKLSVDQLDPLNKAPIL